MPADDPIRARLGKDLNITLTDADVIRRRPFSKRFGEQRYLFLMIVPGIVLVAVFCYAPLFGWIMAFTDYKLGHNLLSGEWVGFTHFIEFFKDASGAAHVIRNTVVINTLTIVINLSLSCVLAILINEVTNRRFRKIVQSTTLFPFFISWPIIFTIFYTFLSSSGVLNSALSHLGIQVKR